MDWSPDGQYVAIARDIEALDLYGEYVFIIFEFNRSNNNLMPVAG